MVLHGMDALVISMPFSPSDDMDQFSGERKFTYVSDSTDKDPLGGSTDKERRGKQSDI